MRTYDLLSQLCPPSGAGAGLARFWELRGRRVFEDGGIRWGQYKGPFYVSLPFHVQLDPERGEIESILRRHEALGARIPSMNHPGMACGMYVCRPAGYDFRSIDRRQRSHVRRGLESCEIRAVPPDQLRAEGLELNRQTMARHARHDAEFGDPVRWARFVDAVARCPEIAVQGAFLHGRLSAYVVTCREDGWLHLLYKMSRSEELGEYTNAALDFTILSEAGRDPSLAAVGNWFAGPLSHPGLDRYKRHMGFSIVPNQLCVFYHALAAPALTSRLAMGALRVAAALRPHDKRWDLIQQMAQSSRLSRA